MTPTEILTTRQRRAQKLKEGRLKTGFDKVKFSELTGLSRKTIDRIEAGRNSWSIDSEIIYLNCLAEHSK